MRVSLRVRVLLLVFAVNAVLFAAGGAFVLQAQIREGERVEREFAENLVYTLQRTIRPDADVQVAHILAWPNWSLIEDAILVDQNLAVSTAGVIQPTGVAINPVGRARRSALVDEQAILRALLSTVETGRPVPGVEGGSTVPIHGPRRADGGRDVWGASWYRAESRFDRGRLLFDVLLWFLVSTVVLTAGTFFLLRRVVLDPVRQIADGARRLREGDLEVRIEEPGRRDEVADLVRSFNETTATLRDFNQRLAREVEIATEKSRRAEAAAMTQRRLAAMGELAAGIAHEINNPLGGLGNAVERLRAGDLPEAKRVQYLALLASGIERIGRTVSQLLRFTPREVHTAPVDLGDVARDAADLFRHRAEAAGVALVLRIEGGPAVVVGARNELGQVVLNLLANALDALEDGGTADPDGPRVEVDVAPRDGGFAVRVEDNGPGVEGSELARIGDLFYTTKEVGRGTGLGLALVHSTVASHGGRVAMTSEPGRGFAVEIWLPADGEEPGNGGSG